MTLSHRPRVSKLFHHRATQVTYTTVWGPDIYRNVIVSGYVIFYPINKLSVNILFFHYSWNGFAGWIWPEGRSLETSDIEYIALCQCGIPVSFWSMDLHVSVQYRTKFVVLQIKRSSGFEAIPTVSNALTTSSFSRFLLRECRTSLSYLFFDSVWVLKFLKSYKFVL